MAEETQQAVFQIRRIYLKDLSLEQPNSPGIFLEMDMPAVEVAIAVDTEILAESVYESSVTVTVTAKIKDKTAYLVEGKQSGIFEIHNVPKDQLDPLLGIGCPGVLYPYLRANIADVITRAGFPPLHLNEIKFEAFYNERQKNPVEKH